MKEALFYEKLDQGKVRCRLCPHGCTVAAGSTGLCGVRRNDGGVLHSMVYDRLIAEHIDPVEKKPLYHFLPASQSYSIATAGCNLTCRHCQNADISQLPRSSGRIDGRNRTPLQIVQAALDSGCRSISYTYTEPTVYYELAFDTARLATQKGLKNIFVTNGYTSPDPIRAIGPYLHAANIDLKGCSETFYHDICGGKLQPVLDAITLYKQLGVWVELTTLIIPGLNDAEDVLEGIAKFIAGLGPEIPWHVTAFYPTYRMTDRPRTPASTLMRARAIGMKAGLRYVYTGNIPGGQGENTFCHCCGVLLLERFGFTVAGSGLVGGECKECKTPCAGVFA